MTTYGPLEPGARIGDLVIEAEIGAGGFGVVYRARDQVVGRLVALKVLAQGPASPTDSVARAKILREVRALGAVVHPNIATLYHVHEIPGIGAGFELEYVDGPSFEAFLTRTPAPSLDDVLRITRGVVAGLRAAHAARVAHGDVKPSNVLIAPDGTPKIVDFGLARILRSDSGKTSSGHGSGTPHYLAPEVVEGGSHTPAGDVWSVGALLYRALAGHVPFEGESLAALYFRVLNLEPAPLPAPIPESVRVLVAACLSKKPERRPPLDDRFLDVLTPKGTAVGTAGVGKVSPPPVALPLIGRTAELAALVERLDVAMAGRATLGVVAGPTGVGKTRLLEALGDAATRRGAEVVRVAVHGHEGLARTVARALSNAPSAASHSRGGEMRAPRGASAEVEAALRAVTATRAVVLLVDDVHRATTDDTRFLSRLVARLEGERLLVVAAGRTDEPGVATESGSPLDALVADADHGFRTDVAPMPKDEILAILEARTRDRTTAPGLLEYVVARSAGNPLFAIHLLAEATAGGKASTTSAGGPRVDAGAPQALKDLFARRLRRLPSPEREVLDAAAVDGVEFDGGAVAVALRTDELDVLRRIERLDRDHGLVEARPRGHRFTHPVLREVVYGEVSPDLRRLYHREIAKHLEGRTSRVDPERLGTHWEAGGDTTRARPALLAAAAAAVDRHEFVRAAALADRAGANAAGLDVTTARAHVDELFAVAIAFTEVARHDDRRAIFTALDAVSRASGDVVLGARVTARRCLASVSSAGLSPEDEQALRDARSALPDGVDRGIACYTLGLVEKYRSRLDEAEALLQEAANLFERSRAPGRRGAALNELGAIHSRRGRADEASRLYAEAASFCREVGRFANAEVSELNGAAIDLDAGRTEGLRARVERSLRTLRAEGARVAAARGAAILARVVLEEGDGAEAYRLLTSAIDELTRAGSLAGRAELHAHAAELAVRIGRTESAAEHRRTSEETAMRAGDADAALLASAVGIYAALCAYDDPAAEREARRVAEHGSRPIGARARDTVAVLLGEAFAVNPSEATWLIARASGLDPRVSPSDSPTGRLARRLWDAVGAFREGDLERLRRAATDVETFDGSRVADRRALAAVWRLRATVAGSQEEATQREAAETAAAAAAHEPLRRAASRKSDRGGEHAPPAPTAGASGGASSD